MGDETGVKSSFKDKFFLVYTGRRTLSISEDPDNLMSGAGSTCPEPRGSSIGEHLILFKLFHHFFGLMNRCVILHKNQAWLPSILSFRIPRYEFAE